MRKMFKLLLALLILVVFASFGFAGQKNLNFFWTQELPSPNDLAGWGLYQSPTAGGPYTKFLDIPFAGNPTGTEYTASTTITVP
jgi:hypothetical protein